MTKLSSALDGISNDKDYCGVLGAFSNEVSALVKSNRITLSESQEILEMVHSVTDGMCS